MNYILDCLTVREDFSNEMHLGFIQFQIRSHVSDSVYNNDDTNRTCHLSIFISEKFSYLSFFIFLKVSILIFFNT